MCQLNVPINKQIITNKTKQRNKETNKKHLPERTPCELWLLSHWPFTGYPCIQGRLIGVFSLSHRLSKQNRALFVRKLGSGSGLNSQLSLRPSTPTPQTRGPLPSVSLCLQRLPHTSPLSSVPLPTQLVVLFSHGHAIHQASLHKCKYTDVFPKSQHMGCPHCPLFSVLLCSTSLSTLPHS